jgi:hypothetical protein
MDRLSQGQEVAYKKCLTKARGMMSDGFIEELEPVMTSRVATAARLSPETLPDEILLLESVVVLRRSSTLDAGNSR